MNLDWPTEGASSGDEGSSFNIVQALLGHKLLLLFFAAVGAGLGYLQFTKSPTVYASSMRMRLIQTLPVLGIEGAERMRSQDFIDTHAVLLRSPVILERAVRDGQLDQIPALGAHAMQRVAGGISVARSSDSREILDLTYRSGDSFVCQKVLDAVSAAYIKYLSESQQSSSMRALDLIKEAKDELLKTLSEKERLYSQFRDQARLVWAGNDAVNIHTQRLNTIEGNRSSAMLELTMLQSQLDAIQDLVKRGANREAILLMIDQLAAEQVSIDSLAETKVLSGARELQALQSVSQLRLEEQLMLEKYGPEHPKMKELSKKIAYFQAIADSERAAAEAAAAANPKPELVQQRDILAVYVQSIQHRIEAQQDKVVKLNALFTAEENASKLLASEENQHRALKEDIDRTKILFETVLTKLQSAELTKETGNLSAEVVIPAAPGRKIAPDLSRSVMMGSVVGLLVGLALSVLIEFSDQSYRTPSDITKHLGVSVIGHVPALDAAREKKLAGKNPKYDPTLVSHYRPSSSLAEAYRTIRTSVMLGSGGQQRVIQVTSPNPSDGKSTLSGNLAITIALSGKRCLLMDCDFRRPRVHKLFGMENTVGISSIINDGVELPDAVQRGSEETLDVLTAGPRVKNPAELLLSPQFAELLKLVRDKYDVVIVDTPPVMAVSDPSTVATMVDGTLLVTRMSRRARPLLQRVRETLGLVNSHILGVVVNGIDEQSSYGGYSPYHQGYAYGRERYYYSAYHDETPAARQKANARG